MKLAFTGEARYPEFEDGYELYLGRCRNAKPVDRKTYSKVVREYCRGMAERLCENGMVDLPYRLGTIAAATISRKPQYRGDKFVGYGKLDWEKGHYDGKMKCFGMVYLPRRERQPNLRCYGFVANRRLFRRMKGIYDDERRWTPLEFNDDMI